MLRERVENRPACGQRVRLPAGHAPGSSYVPLAGYAPPWRSYEDLVAGSLGKLGINAELKDADRGWAT